MCEERREEPSARETPHHHGVLYPAAGRRKSELITPPVDLRCPQIKTMRQTLVEADLFFTGMRSPGEG
jgi:hypothetical protein